MVIIETLEGEVSGFVSRDELHIDDEEGLLKALVVGVSDESVQVRLRGSFFTTTGLAEFSSEWAESNAQVLVA